MIYDLSIIEASKLIASKEVSPVELTEVLLNRIDAVEPHIQAWAILSKKEALMQARQAEKEILQGERRSPLHGIPFGAKDLYYTAGIKTSAGSKVNGDFIPNTDATVVAKLKDAGAILLGKNTMTEYAFFGGVPAARNPWNLEHTPGGSSTGSAAAIASSMALFTLGTQTAGSLSRPAAFNGITTLKATYGRISRAGIIPGSWSLDHAGAFTHSVEDMAVVLQVIAGYDPLDSTSLKEPVPDYSNSLKSDVKGIVLGIPDTFFFDDIDAQMGRVFQESIQCLQKLGAKTIRVSMPESLLDANRAHSTVMKTEAAFYHQEFYQKYADLYNPQLREMLEDGQLTSAMDYLQAQRTRAIYREDLIHLLNGIDALVTPAALGIAPKGLSYTGSPILNIPFTNAGVPTLTIPAGFCPYTGLPLGLQFAARPLAEEQLLSLGFAFQNATNWHRLRPGI